MRYPAIPDKPISCHDERLMAEREEWINRGFQPHSAPAFIRTMGTEFQESIA
jgi:hypothetical protein